MRGQIPDHVYIFLEKTEGDYSLSEAKRDFERVTDVLNKGAREIREAMFELSTLKEKGPGPFLSSISDGPAPPGSPLANLTLKPGMR